MNFILVARPRRITKEQAFSRHLHEARLFSICHVFFDQSARVRDLSLLVDVVVLHRRPQRILVHLDQATDALNVEQVWVGAAAKVLRQRHLLTRALRAATVDLQLTDAVWTRHFQ